MIRMMSMAVMLVGLAACIWLICRTMLFDSEPDARRAFVANRDAFLNPVLRIQSGTWRMRDDNQGFVVTDTLHYLGVQYIRQDSDCIAFVFASGATKPTDRIVYLPPYVKAPPDYGTQAIRIEDRWYFVRTD